MKVLTEANPNVIHVTSIIVAGVSLTLNHYNHNKSAGACAIASVGLHLFGRACEIVQYHKEHEEILEDIKKYNEELKTNLKL